MDWGELLNSAAQDRVSNLINPKPATPATVTQGGQPYYEGKPAAMPAPAVAGTIFGMPKMVVIGGAAVVAIGLFLMMRK